MVAYHSFLKLLEKHILEYYPGGQECRVEIRQVQKNNIILDGMSIVKPGRDENIAPVLYLGEAWERYLATDDLDGVFAEIAKQYYEMVSQQPISIDADSLFSKENLFCQIVNTKANEERLQNIPHQNFLDLSVICRCRVKSGEDGIDSFVVNDDVMERIGLSQEKMFDLAMENTFCMFPLKIFGMGAMLQELITSGEDQTEYHDNIYALEQAWDAGERMFILTNSQCINGAISMMDKDFLATAGNILKNDFYILPSSIHEVILLPTETADAEDFSELQCMVKQVNHDAVSPEERLSNNVYYFDRSIKEIRIVGDRAAELERSVDVSRCKNK